MARQYEVKGTKTYLYWSIGLFFLCLWAIKDGWFPSEKMEEHVLFNQTRAVGSGIASLVCIIVHRFVK